MERKKKKKKQKRLLKTLMPMAKKTSFKQGTDTLDDKIHPSKKLFLRIVHKFGKVTNPEPAFRTNTAQ